MHTARASLFSPCLLLMDVSVWATSPLGVAARRIICGFFFFFNSWLCCPLRFQNSPQTHWWEGFLVFGNFSSFTTSSPGWVSIPNSFVSFYLLYSALPPFKENRLPFWVPGVLHQRSEVVLWNLLSVQMLFWWICGRESGLPVLFLHHFRAAPLHSLLLSIFSSLFQWNSHCLPLFTVCGIFQNSSSSLYFFHTPLMILIIENYFTISQLVSSSVLCGLWNLTAIVRGWAWTPDVGDCTPGLWTTTEFLILDHE